MRKLLSLLVLSLCVATCIYPYTPDLEEAPEGVLSVDGNICIGELSTVRLGLLSSLWPTESPSDGFSTYNIIPQAQSPVRVWLEDDQGGLYQGEPEGFINYLGTFSIDTKNAPEDRRYRLCVEALDAKYISDWSELMDPPVIKEILFGADDYNVNVSVSLDGGTDGTGYMILNYDETWEFHVDYPLRYEVDTDTWLITPLVQADYSKYWCWHSNRNDLNYLVDYTGMTGDGVTAFPLISFPRINDRNHRRYCINVKARTITPKTYRFLKNQQDNTEGGDNLFTPEPGEIAGNLHCETDPERMVLGYVLFSKTTSKRAFLDSRYLQYAPPQQLLYFIPEKYYDHYKQGYRPLAENPNPNPDPASEGPYGWGSQRCYDCTAVGGTQRKPSYWDETE